MADFALLQREAALARTTKSGAGAGRGGSAPRRTSDPGAYEGASPPPTPPSYLVRGSDFTRQECEERVLQGQSGDFLVREMLDRRWYVQYVRRWCLEKAITAAPKHVSCWLEPEKSINERLFFSILFLKSLSLRLLSCSTGLGST